MSSTAVVWLRRDLRLHDSPPLARALASSDRVALLFVIDRQLISGRFSSGSRLWFLLESLQQLREEVRQLGGELFVRSGEPVNTVINFAQEVQAASIYWASDATPYALKRDRALIEALATKDQITAVPCPGNFVADISKPRTQSGKPYTVFTPFWKAWSLLPRREVEPLPQRLVAPEGVAAGEIPTLASFNLKLEVKDPPAPGERAARIAMERWLEGGITDYHLNHDRLAGGSSELAAYLRFGCISPLELAMAAAAVAGEGPQAFIRQLAWRDFYAHVLLHYPDNRQLEFQSRYRTMRWDADEELFTAWCEGRTGYPLIDAAMRQLLATGFMHNRARMVVGSFLTKDLHLDWRLGEAHFMRYLIDGEVANNNGNWQWIASVGVDPAPYFRRMFNPILQQQKFDPDGEYVKRWLPELKGLPRKYLAEPWRTPSLLQRESGCVIGKDYPSPVVDHAQERLVAVERYKTLSL